MRSLRCRIIDRRAKIYVKHLPSERQKMKHELITAVSPRGAYIGTCACGKLYVESRGRDRGSVAEMKSDYAAHVKAQND